MLARARAENAVMVQCLLTLAFRDAARMRNHGRISYEASVQLRDGRRFKLELFTENGSYRMSDSWPTAYTIQVRDEDNADEVLWTATEQPNYYKESPLSDTRQAQEANFLALKNVVECCLEECPFLAACRVGPVTGPIVSINSKDFSINLELLSFNLEKAEE
jgi:hypothetical protein